MITAEARREAESLKLSADRAMMAGDSRTARGLFERGVDLDPRRVDLWIGLAACRRASGDPRAALEALEGALAADPRCFPALLMKGSLLEALGMSKRAAMIYGTALSIAPPLDGLADSTRRAIAHAREVHDGYTADLAGALKAALGLGGGARSSAEGKRLGVFIEAMAGRRKIYHQEPVQFHYPGLPAIEFFERDEFPWLEALEARTGDIRAEALSVLAERSGDLEPYINYPDGLPLDQWAGLNRSLDWSAFHFYLYGQAVDANCRRCPATMAALAMVEQPNVQGRSPSAMFSILKPRTRIPPHTGVANTRAVLHLPLIVPEGCGFRVGGETRQWREGEAWVFDDTIEHEAWNDSGRLRTILICDVWNPRLPPAEREMVATLIAAMDTFQGETPGAGL